MQEMYEKILAQSLASGKGQQVRAEQATFVWASWAFLSSVVINYGNALFFPFSGGRRPKEGKLLANTMGAPEPRVPPPLFFSAWKPPESAVTLSEHQFTPL